MTTTFLSATGSVAVLLGYMGPGPGLTMLGALIGLLLTLTIAFWSVLRWPFRAMMCRRRRAREEGHRARGEL